MAAAAMAAAAEGEAPGARDHSRQEVVVDSHRTLKISFEKVRTNYAEPFLAVAGSAP